jgi:RHS repeat-associated protein
MYFIVLLMLYVSITNAQSVGTIKGVFEVSAVGSAQYSIPIKITPGYGGLEPSLSLDYGSQAGNDIMGMGWQLTGISSISRVSNNIHHDKKTTGVSLTPEDKFSLDGNRLILISGTAGAPGAQYRTEVESYREIEVIGSSGSGPSSFKVTDQSGKVYEYGSTAGTRAQIAGVNEPYAWLLTKVTDLNGNYMVYTYINSTTEVPRLSSIFYNGNQITGSPAISLIGFGYETRPDPNFQYLAGGKVNLSYRLKNIYVQALGNGGLDWETIGSYHLEYATDVYSHLIRVTEKGHELAGTPEALTPSSFEYGTPVNTPSVVTNTVAGSGNGTDALVTGDFNGDGFTDFVRLPKYYNSGSNTWDLFLNNSGSGYTPVQTVGLPPVASEFSSSLNTRRNYATTFFDLNGDGMDDFFYRSLKLSGSTILNNYHVFTSAGTSLNALPKPIVPHNAGSVAYTDFFKTYPMSGDFDGDGKTEILVLKGSLDYTTSFSYNYMIGEEYLHDNGTYLLPTQLQSMPFDGSYVPATGNGGHKLFVIDADGDGKSEILSVWSTPSVTPVAQVFRLNVTFDANNKPVIGDPAFVLTGEGIFPTLYHDIFPGDFNGDGVTDFLTWKDTEGWKIGYGNGKGVVTEVQTAPSGMNKPNVGTNVTRPIMVADYDGDGKSDIYDYTPDMQSTYNWGTPYAPRVHYSKGNNTFETTSYSINGNSLAFLAEDCWPGDWDGDGNTDLFNKRYSYQNVHNIAFRPNEERHLIHKMANGLGEENTVRYLPITNTSVYASGSSIYTYPFIKRTIPIRVVAASTNDNGINKQGNGFSYFYVGLRYNAHGKGLLGFESKTVRDLVKNISTSQQYFINEEFCYVYLYNSLSAVSGNLWPIHSYYNHYGFHDFGNKRFFPYMQEKYEFDNINNTNVHEIYTYEPSSPFVGSGYDIGKPVRIETDKGDGQDIRIQSFEYPWIGGGYPSYLLSQPQLVTTEQTRQGQPPYIRWEQNEYHPSTGLLLAKINDAGTSMPLTTEYAYNAYGNPITKTISAPGLTSRTESYTYDPRNRFVTSVINFSFPTVTSTKQFHIITGTLTNETNSDGYVTSYTYDGFGRIKTVSDNNGMVSTTSMGWDLNFGRYFVKQETNVTAPVVKYYDRLERLVNTQFSGFDGQTLWTRALYNDKGQIEKDCKATQYYITPLWTEYHYNDWGQKIEEIRPEGPANFQYDITGSGLTTTSINPAGQTKVVNTDKAGRITSVIDDGGELSYTYHSIGLLERTELSGPGTIAYTVYDDFGRKSQASDANYNGSYEYEYNAYGELKSTKDPSGNIYQFDYNNLGQMTTKTGPDGTYDYEYNYVSGNPNCGKMVKLTHSGTGAVHNYDYGIGKKMNYEERIFNSHTFKTEFTYDGYGRINSRKYPNNVIVQYSYNGIDGTVDWIGRPGNTIYVPTGLYSVLKKNKFGQVTEAGHMSQFYSGPMPNPSYPSPFYKYTTYQHFDDDFGLLTEQRTADPANVNLRRYSYSFDPVTNNLMQRKDLKYGLAEDFTFDNLNRLSTTSNNSSSESLGYDNNGNINEKSDAGTFTYDQANRLTEIEPYLNISIAKQKLEYTPFNMVESIYEQPWQAQFSYWPDGKRSSMLLTNNGALQKRMYYVPDYEQQEDAGGNIRQRCYVTGPQGSIVAIIEVNNGVEKTLGVLTDHLGSITQVITNTGSLTEEKAYDAWGRLRDPQSWAAYPANLDLGQPDCKFDRGYTGHEHLPQFGIINMNGRLYDPVMGRMFGPDPYIQQIDNTQNFNRYSYCLNNPLKYTDPSGELLFEFLTGYIGGFFGSGGSFWDKAHNGWMNAKQKINTSGNILAGQFAGNFKQIMSRHFFESFQNGIGLFSMMYMNIIKPDLQATHFDGATVVTGLSANKNSPGVAVTLGSYIYGNSSQLWAGTDNQLFMHEYGHYIQGQKSGPLFLFKYGIPSLLTENFDTPWGLGFAGSHDDFWVEQDANARAWDYFSKNHGLTSWDDTIDPRGEIRNAKWWEHALYIFDPLAIVRRNRF